MAGGTGDDETGQRPPLPQERLGAAEGGLSAPILFFDTAPVCGMRRGVFSLVLEAFVQDAGEGEATDNHRVVVAHLRTTSEGLRSLKAAIEKIELMAAKPAGGTN